MNHMKSLLRHVCAAIFLSCASIAATAATLSGSVTFPTSDNGWSPRTVTARVRVMGSGLSAAVVENPANQSTATFTLTNVPAGPVTLVLEEPLHNGTIVGDWFTQDSKRLAVDVAGDVSGLSFSLVYHWQNLPSYPPPYHNPSYDIWQPYFVSDQIGFMSFLNRGVSPMVHELWRTTNGGTSWSQIGQWVHGIATGIPDFVSGLDMLFADADHGVMTARFGPPNYTPVGVLRTADGGATWEGIDFPNVPPTGGEPGGNGRIGIGNYAAIDATHWIACGSENVGTYMGSGVPAWVTIWETADAGATWQIALSWREDYGNCSAIGVESSGRAFAFDTPYAFGGNRILVVRNVAGEWSFQAGNNMVTNQGYGPADAPMAEGTAWITGARWDGHSTTEQGIFRSVDGGATWSRISAALLHSFDFGTERKAFATAGGPAYASYDSGRTWRYQSAGGGVCCHGTYMFASGINAAIWKDGGVGDPNGLSDVFRYVEAASPNLEVLAGTGVSDSTVKNGATLAPIAAFQLTSRGTVALALQPMRIRASGTGNDRTEIAAVGLWWDRNANGVVDGDDLGLASATFNADNGEAVLDPAGALVLNQLYPQQLLVTYDLSARVRGGVTFSAAVDPSQVAATTTDGSATTVPATAPPGTLVVGRTITSMAVVPIPPAIPAQTASEGVSYVYVVPPFTDPNGDTLTYAFAGMPAWLRQTAIDVNPRYIVGVPPYGESSATTQRRYTITVTATDPGGDHASTSFTLDVLHVNHTPTPPPPLPTLVATEHQSFTYVVPPFTDRNGDPLTYYFMGLPAWLRQTAIGINPRYLAGMPPFTESTHTTQRSYTFTMTAMDPDGASDQLEITLSVVNVNNPPVPPVAIPAQTATERTSFRYIVPAFTDPNGDLLSYSFSGLPAWLTQSAVAVNPRYLSGTPPYSESTATTQRRYMITATATDPAGASASRSFTLDVVHVNSPPVPPAPIPTRTATEGVSFTYVSPQFTDPNGDVLSYSFSGLPGWLQQTAITVNPRYLAGRPPFSESTATTQRSYTITAIATDPDGATASRTFTLNVVNVNNAPVAPASIPPQTATEGRSFTYVVPPFTDPNGDVLSYSFSGLPSWLSQTAITINPRYLAGLPPRSEATPGNPKVYTVTATATDPDGLTASRNFTVTVLDSP